MLQFLSIRGFISVGTSSDKQLEGKAKPNIANPKTNIGDKAKNLYEAQTITNENMPMQMSRIG